MIMSGSKAKNSIVLAQKEFLVWDPLNTNVRGNRS